MSLTDGWMLQNWREPLPSPGHALDGHVPSALLPVDTEVLDRSGAAQVREGLHYNPYFPVRSPPARPTLPVCLPAWRECPCLPGGLLLARLGRPPAGVSPCLSAPGSGMHALRFRKALPMCRSLSLNSPSSKDL